jgi:hypothetical protein
MDFYQARDELPKMSRKHLLSLASTKRVSKCFLGGRARCLHLHYQGFNFCVSEIMGEGCRVERLAKVEEVYQNQDGISCPLPLMGSIEISPLSSRKKAVEFKAYCKDPIKKSMIFLGNILERRTKERRNNLTDLLVKAVKDYSYCVEVASTVFLLGHRYSREETIKIQGVMCVGFFRIGILQKNMIIFSVAFAIRRALFLPILFLSR